MGVKFRCDTGPKREKACKTRVFRGLSLADPYWELYYIRAGVESPPNALPAECERRGQGAAGQSEAVAGRDGEADRPSGRKFIRREQAFAGDVGAFLRIGEPGGDDPPHDG